MVDPPFYFATRLSNLTDFFFFSPSLDSLQAERPWELQEEPHVEPEPTDELSEELLKDLLLLLDERILEELELL